MPDDSAQAVLALLNEVLDLVADAKQGHRAVPEGDDLHRELDALLDDLLAWVVQLGDRARHLGVGLVGSVTTVAGRRPANLFPERPAPDRVAGVLVDYLRPAVHQAHHDAARETVDLESRELLAAIAGGLDGHVDRLKAAARRPPVPPGPSAG